MDTLIGNTERSSVQQWWGYLRNDGTFVVKPYTGMAAIKAAEHATGVTLVRGPFLAVSRDVAFGILKRKIQIAQAKAAQRLAERQVSYSPGADLSGSTG